MLTREERQVLAELELCSHGTTQSFEPIPTKSGSSSRIPPAANSPHITYRDRLLAEDDPGKRAGILEQARADLRHHRRRVAPKITGETEREFDDRIRSKFNDGWPVNEIARAMNCTPTRVRRAVSVIKLSPVDASIEQLAGEGHSVRFIAMRLGIPKSTVQDALTRARKRAA